MLKLTIKDFDKGNEFTAYGNSGELLTQALREFPEFHGQVHTVDDLVEIMNKSPFYHAEVKVVVVYGTNVLPEDYLTADQGEDPWPRQGDVKDE